MEEEKVKGFLGEWLEKSGKVEVMCPQPLEDKPKRWWKRSFRFGRFYLTFSNCRVKKRLPFHNTSLHCKLADNLRDIKGKMYEKQEHRCPHCGREMDVSVMELHHVLPWARFPELRAKRANMLLLCHACHKEIHCNPYLNIRLMEEKAKEFGIDLNERYDYGNIRDCESEATGTDEVPHNNPED